ncbi:unnamed protein product, partial [Allacma fusca]
MESTLSRSHGGNTDVRNACSSASSSKCGSGLTPCEHHVQEEVCQTRAVYRQGKEFTAVKVYTVNHESRYLILQNIPDLNLQEELRRLCGRFGAIQEFGPVSASKYPPGTPFTAVYVVKYASTHHARYAKRKLDNRAFYGGLIHICYAPELESVLETREKLLER